MPSQADRHGAADGLRRVAAPRAALVQIIAQVGQINSAVGEIAASAQEQAVGLAEVNTAINQMDQITQQNSGMVEQSTTCGHSLHEEAEELGCLTSGFRLGDIEDSGGRTLPEAHPRTVVPLATSKGVPRRGLIPTKAA